MLMTDTNVEYPKCLYQIILNATILMFYPSTNSHRINQLARTGKVHRTTGLYICMTT